MNTTSSAQVTFEEAPPIPTYNPAGNARVVTRAAEVAPDENKDEPDLMADLLARVRAIVRSARSRTRV